MLISPFSMFRAYQSNSKPCKTMKETTHIGDMDSGS